MYMYMYKYVAKKIVQQKTRGQGDKGGGNDHRILLYNVAQIHMACSGKG